MGSSCWNLKHRFEKFGRYLQPKTKVNLNNIAIKLLHSYSTEKNIGLSNLHQVSLENQDPRSQMPFAVLHQSRSNSAEYPDCPAPTLPQVDFFCSEFSAENSSEEVTLKYGKLCVIFFQSGMKYYTGF